MYFFFPNSYLCLKNNATQSVAIWLAVLLDLPQDRWTARRGRSRYCSSCARSSPGSAWAWGPSRGSSPPSWCRPSTVPGASSRRSHRSPGSCRSSSWKRSTRSLHSTRCSCGPCTPRAPPPGSCSSRCSCPKRTTGAASRSASTWPAAEPRAPFRRDFVKRVVRAARAVSGHPESSPADRVNLLHI